MTNLNEQTGEGAEGGSLCDALPLCVSAFKK
jgi:hypothetical protein